MKHTAYLGLCVLAISSSAAFAQADNLTDQQRMGRQVFAQSCGVCHLPPALNARTYGPPLNKDAGGGDPDVVREFIENGTPRMPAWKYYLKPPQIDAIISYLIPFRSRPPLRRRHAVLRAVASRKRFEPLVQ